MEEEWWNSEETDHSTADDSGSDMNDESLRSPPDKDFTAEPPSVIGVIAFSIFVVPGAIIFGGVGVWLLFFSIMNPYHEDGGLVGFVLSLIHI